MSPNPPPTTEPVIELSQVVTRFGDHVVHAGIDLAVQPAEIFAIIGGSGSGKSTLLREMILLHTPDAGSIRVLGSDLARLDRASTRALRRRWGVMFQHGGLFGSLTVTENIGLPLREHTRLNDALIDQLAAWKLAQVGLPAEVGAQVGSQVGAQAQPPTLVPTLVPTPSPIPRS